MLCKCCLSPMNKYQDYEKIYKCGECSHIYRDFSHINLNKFYKEYRNKGRKKQYNKYFTPGLKTKFSNILIDTILDYVKNSSSMLEIGSYQGYLSNKLKNYCPSITCCELDKSCHANLKSLGFRTIQYFTELTEKFDSVILIDVMEHFNELDSYVEKLSELCSKYVIIQVPIRRKIHYKEPFDGHFHYFTIKSLSKLFQRYGMELDFSKVMAKKQTARKEELICVFKKI